MTAAAPACEPVNILLVDDRPANLHSLQALLGRPDYNLVLARSGAEALGQVLRRDFALILLDVAMPGMDGFEVASLIKEREQSMHIPIIFVTASVYEMDEVVRGYDIGAVDYLRKPLDGPTVRSKVAVFVELYRQRKQIERQSARLREAELREQRRQREQVEEALRESESLYQLTCEEALIGIAHASPEGHLTRVNRYLGELVGTPVEHLLGRGVETLVVADEAAALLERLAQLRTEAVGYRGEHRLRPATKASPELWVDLSLTALRNGQGELRQFVLVVNDISLRKQRELERARVVRELQEAIRVRDDFIALAAHELRTPSTPLRLQAEGLLRLLERDPEELTARRDALARRLSILCRAAQRLESLVDRLLDVSNLTLAQVELQRETVDLAAVCTEVVGRFRAEAERAGASLELEGAARPVTGCWDRLRLEQVLDNLLSNAIRFGAGEPITIALSADARCATLTVRDRGAGIPLEAQTRIFDRFERVAPIAHYGGLGVGLWLVRRIVEAHDGLVHVWSEPGQGTRFTVELPRRIPALAGESPDGERALS